MWVCYIAEDDSDGLPTFPYPYTSHTLMFRHGYSVRTVDPEDGGATVLRNVVKYQSTQRTPRSV